MNSLEDIVSLFENPIELKPFADDLRYPRLIDTGSTKKRILLSRGPKKEYEVLIIGELDSFGAVPQCAGIDCGPYHEPDHTVVNALRIALRETDDNKRLISHVAYECERLVNRNPEVSNVDLIAHLSPYFRLIQNQSLLTTQEQIGLFAELLFLERLIDLCDENSLPVTNALESWSAAGSSNASRDFSRRGIVIEVKGTGRQERSHAISSLKQLELDVSGGEIHLFLCSLSVCPDASGRWRLCDLVEKLSNKVGASKPGFLGLLQRRGYDVNFAKSYELCTKFNTSQFAFAMYDVADLLMPRLSKNHFDGGRLPPHVSDVKYRLNLSTFSSAINPLAPDTIDAHLQSMMS